MGIDWDIFCFADVPHLGKSIKNALTNQKILKIDKKYVDSEEYNLPTDLVDVAAIRAVIDFDKQSELKLAPHLPKDALDLGNVIMNRYWQQNVQKQTHIHSRRLPAH